MVHISWILIFCFGFFFSCLDAEDFSMWKKREPYQNIFCHAVIMNYASNIDVTRCLILCEQEEYCHSVFYIRDHMSYCYFVNAMLFSTKDCIQVLNAEHYFPRHEPSCHPDDELYRTVHLADGHFTYKVVQSRIVNQPTAKQKCETSGGLLAKLSTIPRMELILELMWNCPEIEQTSFFVDGSNADATDYTGDGAWKWHDGEPISMNSTFWGHDQPNNPHQAHCVLIKSKGYGKLYDERCHYEFGYICGL